MKEYQLFLSVPAYDRIERMSKRKRAEIMARLEAIRRFPARFGHGHLTDDLGRRIEIHVFGKLTIRYWDDFADRHIKILSIADRT